MLFLLVSLDKKTTIQQKGNYQQKITFHVVISFGRLLKCYQIFSHKNKEDMKIVKKIKIVI